MEAIKGVLKGKKYLTSTSKAQEDIYQQKAVLSLEKEIDHIYTQPMCVYYNTYVIIHIIT